MIYERVDQYTFYKIIFVLVAKRKFVICLVQWGNVDL